MLDGKWRTSIDILWLNTCTIFYLVEVEFLIFQTPMHDLEGTIPRSRLANVECDFKTLFIFNYCMDFWRYWSWFARMLKWLIKSMQWCSNWCFLSMWKDFSYFYSSLCTLWFAEGTRNVTGTQKQTVFSIRKCVFPHRKSTHQ